MLQTNLRVPAELGKVHQLIAGKLVIAQCRVGKIHECEGGLQSGEFIRWDAVRLDLRDLIHASLLIGLQNRHHILHIRFQFFRIGLGGLRRRFELGDGLFSESKPLFQSGTDLLKRLVNGIEGLIHLAQFGFDGVEFGGHLVGKIGIQGVILGDQVFGVFHVIISVVIIFIDIRHFFGGDCVILGHIIDIGGGLLCRGDGLGDGFID